MSRPGLVDPYALYQSLRSYVCSAVYETRTYGAMRGAGGNSPHLLYYKSQNYNEDTKIFHIFTVSINNCGEVGSSATKQRGIFYARLSYENTI